MTPILQQDIEYVDVRHGCHEPTNFYERWVDQSSAKHAAPELIAADALRKMYPGYSLVVSDDYGLTNLLALPDIRIHPSDSDKAELEQVSNVVFTPISRRIAGKVAGSLVDRVILGSYEITWNESDFVVHITQFQNGNFIKTVHFILHDGPEQPARDLVLTACLYTEQTHDEVWVFNQGIWSKNAALWIEIKDSSWDDVVMKEESKKMLQKDIYGFFKSETTYKKFSIPWKRGLILHGPPGNGKTITIKVVMKTCTQRGFTPLYVKSFQSYQGEEGAMQSIFLKARQLAPCVLILEDLDSLINDRNRSFFLNQLDGLETNDGLLVIASTNHLDRLDPGLSNRPSRFDRKYLFDDPDYQERVLYAKYWQEKLKDNDEIAFPVSLVEEVADLTQGFSFAYLKEAFVSTLVRITDTDTDGRVEFSVMLKSQIMALRKELGKQTPVRIVSHRPIPRAQPEKELDERISLIKQLQLSTTSQKDKFSQGSRGPRQLPLPADASDDFNLLSQTARINRQPPVNSPGPRTDKFYGTLRTPHSGKPFPQGCVLHAPPSAYPQVMPGSLPSASLDPSAQDPTHPARHGAPVRPSASTSGVVIIPKNPFSTDNAPLIKIDDDVHADESFLSAKP
ncbi:P-loop containing nucleoside triphosphate hydrolase protein [Butyriboletus roseoflavus]|nr:P-loop containing nucleoside triphosphate hydrolase protein [Butyriboletus roseoflavus]